MQIKDKRLLLIGVCIGALPVIFIGYLVGGAWEEGIDAFTFINNFNAVCEAPFRNYLNHFTLQTIGITLMVYAVVVLMYYTSQRNLMPGKEFGTSKFEPPAKANKLLADIDDSANRILSKNVKMSMDFRRLKLNGNILICGGSGAGKTFYEVKPNLMQMPQKASFVITDPKGEILRSCGQMLRENGYRVKVLNLVEMDKSDGYNPFNYIREETDVVKLITNLISNTTPKGSNPSDPFWERAEGLLLQALFYYVWLEVKPARRNFEMVLKLLGEAEVKEQGKPSKLDIRMKYLEETNPLGSAHPAVKQYNKCMRGAGDTVRSIIISANSRLAFLENKQVLKLLARDEINLAELGIGANGDGKTKTALFCVIPDTDKSYNFIVGMLYTQIFQELYYQADFNCGGRLPIHVTFMMDEFANVALPDDFCSLLSTMRSREISSVIIIQNFAQLKALFKDTWETIPGNCDTFIYLGGNEQSTHKYVSELLGKGTIDKRTNGETRGRQGSASRNFDVVGRELFMAAEVRRLDNKMCFLFIRGLNPILDDKYVPINHPMFKHTEDGGGEAYVHHSRIFLEKSKQKGSIGPAVEILTSDALSYYEKRKEDGENVYIDTLTYEEFMALDSGGVKKRFIEQEEQEEMEKFHEEEAGELEYAEEAEVETSADAEASDDVDSATSARSESNNSDSGGAAITRTPGATAETLMERMATCELTNEQQREIEAALMDGLSEDIILKLINPNITAAQMRQQREEQLSK